MKQLGFGLLSLLVALSLFSIGILMLAQHQILTLHQLQLLANQLVATQKVINAYEV